MDYATLPTRHLSIRVNANPMSPDRVKIAYNGDDSFLTEYSYPYAFPSEMNGNYTGWKLDSGTHTITATPVVNDVDGTPLTLNFSIVEQ